MRPQTPRQCCHSAYHNCHNFMINSKWTVKSGINGLVGCAIVIYDLLVIYVISTVHMRIRNIFSNKHERCFVPTHIFNANAIHNCLQLKFRDVLTANRNLPTEMTMCRICILHSLCGATDWEFAASNEGHCKLNNAHDTLNTAN